jgi:hypothetical protein
MGNYSREHVLKIHEEIFADLSLKHKVVGEIS